jgi:DNA polymerase-3 subunit delta
MEQQQKPVVYIFYGDDAVAINESIAELKARIGDPSTIDLNYITLDGRSLAIEQLETAGRSLPFLADRRLTVLNHPLALMQSDANRKRVITLLEALPDESAVVLAEYGPLQTEKEKRNRKASWLLKWADSMGRKVYIKKYSAPRGSQLTGWIITRARKMGGEFEPQAASSLAKLLGDNVRLADQEIIKLLTYVNYERPVAETDVEELTAQLPEGGIFDFVDALGNRDREKATSEFHRLLVDNDIQNIFGMIVRQFRLLVQSREILDNQGGKQEISSLLKVHPFVGGKLAVQARHFSQSQLDSIFHRLLEIDSGLKTGKMSTDLSVDLLIADIT